MKERLVQLLDLEQLSPSKFADIIGVQRSSVSHVVSGRNKPSFDFLQKTLKAFPGLNAEWLILGEGTMYEKMGRGGTGTLFDAPPEPDELSFADNIPGEGANEEQIRESDATNSEKIPPQHMAESPSTVRNDTMSEVDEKSSAQQPELSESEGLKSAGKRKVVQVMLIFDDDTFRSYNPSN